jgi:hypothetical protein
VNAVSASVGTLPLNGKPATKPNIIATDWNEANTVQGHSQEKLPAASFYMADYIWCVRERDINYPSAPGRVPFSPTMLWCSESSTSSSSEEPALEDSSSLSAKTLRTGLDLDTKHNNTGFPSVSCGSVGIIWHL